MICPRAVKKRDAALLEVRDWWHSLLKARSARAMALFAGPSWSVPVTVESNGMQLT